MNSTQSRVTPEAVEDLIPREREILVLMARPRQQADRVSAVNQRRDRSNARRSRAGPGWKPSSTVQAVVVAYESGLVTPPSA